MTRLKVRFIGLLILIWAAGSVRGLAGACAVSDASALCSEDGCMLAFSYNQEGDCRLVVLDEQHHRHYEAPLDNARMAPFWEGGKVYVLSVSGEVQGFSIKSGKLVPEKAKALVPEVVAQSAYAQHRLYCIHTVIDSQRKISHYLSATDFPTRKTLWTKKIEDLGLIRVMDQYVCVMGLNLVQVYNCETGEKIAGIAAAKATAAASLDK